MAVIYPEGLMHKKVNIFIALLILAILVIGVSYFISAKALGPGIGVNIISPPMKCTLDPGTPPPGTCNITCSACGSLTWICASLFEVKATFLSGTNSLYQGQAFCLSNPIPPNGGIFRSGGQCLGNVMGMGPHTLMNFGCSL